MGVGRGDLSIGQIALGDPIADAALGQPLDFLRGQTSAAHAQQVKIGEILCELCESIEQHAGVLVLATVTYEQHVSLRQYIQSRHIRAEALVHPVVHNAHRNIEWSVDVFEVFPRCLRHTNDVIGSLHVAVLEGEAIESAAGMREALGDHVVDGHDALGTLDRSESMREVEGVVHDLAARVGLWSRQVVGKRSPLVAGFSSPERPAQFRMIE